MRKTDAHQHLLHWSLPEYVITISAPEEPQRNFAIVTTLAGKRQGRAGSTGRRRPAGL